MGMWWRAEAVVIAEGSNDITAKARGYRSHRGRSRRHVTEGICQGTWETWMPPERVETDKGRPEEVSTGVQESDEPIVPRKQGNARGGKGLTVRRTGWGNEN